MKQPEAEEGGAADTGLDQQPIRPQVSHAVLLTGAQLSRGLLRTLFVLTLARVLGPGRFGVYVLLLATVEMLATASGSGYGDYLTREAAKDERLGWGLGEQLIWLRLVCIVPLIALGIGVLWLLGYPRLVLVASACMSVSLFPRALSEAVQGVLRGTGRYLQFLFVELALGLTLVGGAVLLLIRGGGLKSVVETEIVGAAAAAMAGFSFAAKYRTKQRLRLKMRRLVKTSGIFNIYGFVANLYDRVDVLLLSRLGGDYATGVYGAAYRPIGAIQLLPYGILYSLLPSLSRRSYSRAEGERLEKAMGLLLSASFVIVLATIAFANPAVRLLLGAPYAEAAIALKILIWAVVLRYVNYAMNIRLLASGLEKLFVATSIVCLAVNFIGNLVFIPLYSWRAAALITVVTEAVLLLQNLYWLRRSAGGIPKPFGMVRTSLVFVVLVIALFVGARVIPTLWTGIACVFFFLVYLYRTGMIREFTAAWRTGSDEPLEGTMLVRTRA